MFLKWIAIRCNRKNLAGLKVSGLVTAVLMVPILTVIVVIRLGEAHGNALADRVRGNAF